MIVTRRNPNTPAPEAREHALQNSWRWYYYYKGFVQRKRREEARQLSVSRVPIVGSFLGRLAVGILEQARHRQFMAAYEQRIDSGFFDARLVVQRALGAAMPSTVLGAGSNDFAKWLEYPTGPFYDDEGYKKILADQNRKAGQVIKTVDSDTGDVSWTRTFTPLHDAEYLPQFRNDYVMAITFQPNGRCVALSLRRDWDFGGEKHGGVVANAAFTFAEYDAGHGTRAQILDQIALSGSGLTGEGGADAKSKAVLAVFTDFTQALGAQPKR